MQKCFNNYFWLDNQIDLPKNSFTINNQSHNVPCVFQIWIKKDIQRYIEPKQNPINFKFVKNSKDIVNKQYFHNLSDVNNLIKIIKYNRISEIFHIAG